MPLPPPPPAALPAAFASISGGVGDGRPCGEEDGAEQTGPGAGSGAARWRTCPSAGATLHLPALHVSCPIPPPHRADFLSGRSLLLSHPFHFSRRFGVFTHPLYHPPDRFPSAACRLSAPQPQSHSRGIPGLWSKTPGKLLGISTALYPPLQNTHEPCPQSSQVLPL